MAVTVEVEKEKRKESEIEIETPTIHWCGSRKGRIKLVKTVGCIYSNKGRSRNQTEYVGLSV